MSCLKDDQGILYEDFNLFSMVANYIAVLFKSTNPIVVVVVLSSMHQCVLDSIN